MKQHREHQKQAKNIYRDALMHLSNTANYDLAKAIAKQYEEEIGCDFWLRKYKLLHRSVLK